MKASSCPNCGAPFQFSTTKLACEFCGYSFDTKQSNTSNALNPNASEGGTSVSSDNLSLQDINFKSIRSKYHYESIIKIVLLTFLTCGLYYIYKLFNWTQILNQADVDEGSKVNPGSVIILSLIIIVAAFNIISGLTILVKNKTREIAILKSIGVLNLKTILS